MAKHTRQFGAWLSRQRIALNQRKNNMTEHEQNLRDLAAMFAMHALLVRNKHNDFPHEEAFIQARMFMEARESISKELDGIAALKRPRKVKDV